MNVWSRRLSGVGQAGSADLGGRVIGPGAHRSGAQAPQSKYSGRGRPAGFEAEALDQRRPLTRTEQGERSTHAGSRDEGCCRTAGPAAPAGARASQRDPARAGGAQAAHRRGRGVRRRGAARRPCPRPQLGRGGSADESAPLGNQPLPEVPLEAPHQRDQARRGAHRAPAAAAGRQLEPYGRRLRRGRPERIRARARASASSRWPESVRSRVACPAPARRRAARGRRRRRARG